MNLNKTDNTLEFLNYIKTPVSKDNMFVLYAANNVNYEKCVLFNDFIQSLIGRIFETYLGDEITSYDDRIKHFNWCWNKVVDDFESESIVFNRNTDVRKYFQQFFIEVFYSVEDKSNIEYIKVNITRLWEYIFKYTNIKTRSDIDTFLEVYNLFNKSL